MLPDILMMPQYDEYPKPSKLTRAIYERHTDQVEVYGMDECWCDVSGRFGKRAIYSACLTGNLKMSSDGREKVVMPGMMYQ
jgi:nucleotidyltransferase/DNA polymerase involved in DNA repair